MSQRDSRGLVLSTNNPNSLARYEQALDLIHGYYMDPTAVLDAALAEEPDFVAAHCMRAGYAILFGDSAAQPQLREAVKAGEDLVGIANDRERRHIAAARAWLDGEFELGSRRYGEILEDYPRDSLALQVAHVGDFFLGQSSLLRDRIAQVLPYWDASVPGYGYLLGMHAFGLEECAEYGRAEASGRRALEINARDPWAVHAVAHVMEMQGRHAEGIEWLNSRSEDWSQNNAFAVHNWWHLALYHLDLGDHTRVLELYDSQVRAQPSPYSLDMVDATAMLWRLDLRGVDIGERWQELANSWERTLEDGFYAFNDVHAMMSFRRCGAPQRHDDAAGNDGAARAGAGHQCHDDAPGRSADRQRADRLLGETSPRCRGPVDGSQSDRQSLRRQQCAARPDSPDDGGSGASRRAQPPGVRIGLGAHQLQAHQPVQLAAGGASTTTDVRCGIAAAAGAVAQCRPLQRQERQCTSRLKSSAGSARH